MEYERFKNLVMRFVFTKNITIRKFINFCLITFQYRITKNSFVIGYPIELVIDPVNICNLHCPLCPTGQGRMERSKGKMSFDNFRKVIDELGTYLYEVDLHNWGEPLLNEEIYAMISYAHKRNIKVNLSTNLNFFDEDKAKKLVESGLDHLIVSLDGASQETYRQYRVGGDFDNVIKGIKSIIHIKKEQNKTFPVLTWQFLVMAQNEREISEAEQMANDLGVDKFELFPIHSDMGRELFLNREERMEIARKWLPQDDKYNSYTLKRNKTNPNTCSFLWFQSIINWNGSISPCCSVYPEIYDFGNIFDSNFKNIWNNAKYKASRKMVRQKRVHDNDMKTVCANCINNEFIQMD
ncbi:MAG: radical SAM protein [Methanosarcinaceae archaeon]|nr:radical SAM protein [Methanosarcinaceae archaeon]